MDENDLLFILLEWTEIFFLFFLMSRLETTITLTVICMTIRSFSWCSCTGSFHSPTQNILIEHWPDKKVRKLKGSFTVCVWVGRKTGSAIHCIHLGIAVKAVFYASHKRCRMGWPRKVRLNRSFWDVASNCLIEKVFSNNVQGLWTLYIHPYIYMHTHCTYTNISFVNEVWWSMPSRSCVPSCFNSGGS